MRHLTKVRCENQAERDKSELNLLNLLKHLNFIFVALKFLFFLLRCTLKVTEYLTLTIEYIVSVLYFEADSKLCFAYMLASNYAFACSLSH